jgi:hypothetical protein
MIRALCHHCNNDFLFAEIYDAAPHVRSTCPRCREPLGIPNADRLFRMAEQSAAALQSALDQIAARAPSFTVRSDPWLGRVEEAVGRTAHPEMEDPQSSLFGGGRRRRTA